MTRSRRPRKDQRNTAPCCGDGWWICMCHTKKPPLYLRKAPTVAEFDLDVAMREHDEWEASEAIACPHFEEPHKCSTCIAELDAEIERDQRAEREALRRAVECPLVPHEGDGGVE